MGGADGVRIVGRRYYGGGGDGITLLEQSLDDNYTWFMVVETD